MLYRASIFAAMLAAGAKAEGGEAFTDVDSSSIEETQAESCALQVKGADAVMDTKTTEYSHDDL